MSFFSSRWVDVPEMPFLVLPGRGDPGLDGHDGGAAHSLLRFARVVRFVLEQGPARVRPRRTAPLEVVGWRRPEPGAGPLRVERWSLLVAQPDEVDHGTIDLARTRVGLTLPAEHVGAVRLVSFAEGASAQLLHVGGADDADTDARRLDEFIVDNGRLPRGRRHLVLLRDRGPATSRRWILRQPVRTASTPDVSGARSERYPTRP